MLNHVGIRPIGLEDLHRYVRTIPDFPKPGIQFKDISPLLADARAFREVIERMAHNVGREGAQCIVGLEARGFIFGVAIAQHLNLPFVPVRKAGKLPGDVERLSYDLEYGKATIEMQRDAIAPGIRVAVVDDLLATGGTAGAAERLISALGGTVTGFHFAIELAELEGRARLGMAPVAALLRM